LQPGLKHIAEECGVSVMAVSMALRDNTSISEKRRLEIKTVAERMGYRPNINARSLRGGKTHSIGILWSLGGPHDSLGLIRDLSLKLMHNDYVSYVADSLSDPKVIESCLNDYVVRNVDGLIIQAQLAPEFNSLMTAENLQCLAKIKNVVIVNESGIKLPAELKYDEIWRQRQPAIDQIVGHFAEQGRKKVAMLEGPLDACREQQFVDCLIHHGLEHENCRLINMEIISNTMTESLLQEICSGGAVNYDALLVHNDEAAAQVINYLQRAGVRVPEDIAVVGFNDSPFAQYFTPPIASVERRTAKLADAAVKLLMRRIKNKNAAVQQLELPMRFVKRESAG
jgi:LacI family transcriptional regulator, galactose operon repressor